MGREVSLPRSQIAMWKRSISIPIILLLALSLLSALSLNVVMVSGVEYPAIYVDPASIIEPTLTPGSNFTISIKTDYTGDDIMAWQLTLSYNPSVIHGINVTNGDLITSDVSPSAAFMPGSFDNTVGELSLTGAIFFYMFPPPTMISGPGTLANVTFTVLGTGDSAITIGYDTKLTGWDSGEYEIVDAFTMPFHIQHGYFRNAVVEHDVAIVGVAASPTEVVEGELVEISVEVENQGTATETFDVTVYYGVLAIETKTVVNLAGGADTTVAFSWNTSAVSPATYTMSAVASTVEGETEIEDNTLPDGTVTVLPSLVAVIEAPDAGYTWTPIPFNGTKSYSNTGTTIVGYNWTFGDGAAESGAAMDHPYKWPGVYGVRLFVTDDTGDMSIDAYHTIEIVEEARYEADLVRWKAQPEAQHWDYSKDDDKNVTLTALTVNTGTRPIDVTVTFAILDARTGGTTVDVKTVDKKLDKPEAERLVTIELRPEDLGYTGAKLVLFAHVTLKYDSDNDGIPDTDASTKIVRFTIVP